MDQKGNRRLIAMCATAVVGMHGVPVRAVGAEASVERNATGDALPEVRVEARKRQEDARDVPISIVAVRGHQLEESQMFRTGDIVRAIPGMNLQFVNPRATSFSIRGLGNNPASEGLDTSVALYVDGVYLSRPGMLSTDLIDIERIEVLRGPQVTLYGRNATAGVVSPAPPPPGAFANTFEVTTAVDVNALPSVASVDGGRF